ncbi:hypothetical protein P8G24_004696 [Salmonella enterica]|nr:hypothetical protein [Salmonella enterica]EKR4225025.1 hypothetical protein [Salmonella enterica]
MSKIHELFQQLKANQAHILVSVSEADHAIASGYSEVAVGQMRNAALLVESNNAIIEQINQEYENLNE